MHITQKILSDVAVFTKYAKHMPLLERRETWEEIVDRNKEMHIKKYPILKDEIEDAYRLVYDKKVLPSMRSLQFAGKPIEVNETRIFNCSYAPVDHPYVFAEAMFLLLSGVGFGFSVQRHHVEKLPEIRKPSKSYRYLIADSIEGWADAVKVLVYSYLGKRSTLPAFDFRDIREKGTPLVTSGGKAPGAQPLKDCLHNIQKVLDTKKDGEFLQPIDVYDIMCYIADAVLAGGIRRSAMICLFSMDDQDMLSSKSGNWWELNPQRARSNNSAVVMRHRVKEQDFAEVWKRIRNSGSGEPAFFLSSNAEWGTNPCCEISLRPNQMCNLTEINASSVTSQEDLDERARVASFIGTLQASYTDFHYLREVWKRTCEKDALLGLSMTGIASGTVLDLDIERSAKVVVEENQRVAELIGINPSARLTCVKPAGTTSLVIGSSSGIHAWHAPHYIRRMRLGKDEAIYQYLLENHPELVEDEVFKPHLQAVLSVPQKAPEGAILRDESALDLLSRVRMFNERWVKAGHVNGDNRHNVSVTVSIKENEWDEVGKWLWENRDTYTGISVLPYDGHTYVQAPFEDITEERYNELLAHLTEVDLTKVIERDDHTDRQGELACAGGACLI
jgi:ribonucleoside-diphosphate reductase alpha chain